MASNVSDVASGSSSEVDYHNIGDNTEDLSYANLDVFPEFLLDKADELHGLQLDHNEITVLPRTIGSFQNLVSFDISNNNLKYISPYIVNLKHLRTFTARNNHLDMESLPKDIGLLSSLQVLNLSGNRFTKLPMQITELVNLKCLQIGANQIETVPPEIGNLQKLEVLYLGGNQLTELPEEIGFLSRLVSLYLCDNYLEKLPASIAWLQRLESLSLHNNQLATLPTDLAKLDLVELSLRNNPLVTRFVQDMVYEPPSLLELAGRVVKVKNLAYTEEDLPNNLREYLDTAQRCVNPKCKGVYFSACVEHIKFVDFCGKYRLPLLQYLCSPRCTKSPIVCSSSESESDEELPVTSKLRKVLLG